MTSPVEVCTECGFEGREWTDADTVSAIADLPGRWSDAVAGLTDADLRRRPIRSMWSIAEYVDHVREVLFRMRVLLDTAVHDPTHHLRDVVRLRATL